MILEGLIGQQLLSMKTNGMFYPNNINIAEA
jgi:hypothetical protein